ncbi:MAG: DUF1599 domain-containing protein [Bacteroidia bacterium]|nr:DUF1599 domain-containing protein [Bacteroidales bacterium]NCD41930.1 DUF1599 domain-containing protein [Bacteroidia bacterium]MDD2322455.1 DUF1599 domain-containing protein [Bacteroidales bacterium]MDD3010158.1 DUF1599 domain-containing protein [Bacteroidales bacterium]MDD3961633.1 DUF1599 domain-containing protein [Bacteroidales bacterium]
MSAETSQQFDQVIDRCRLVFMAKAEDYSSAWRILRASSLTDQIYIKANRIRSIERKGTHKINEGILPEFIGIVNYSIMALVQLNKGVAETDDLSAEEALLLYDHFFYEAKKLMMDKNYDYGGAWKNMRISSLIDIILMKLLRIKQIENNAGHTLVSEGVDAGYYDIINYAVFALIKLMDAETNNE